MKVLVVDNEPAVERVVVLTLLSFGHEAVGVNSVEEAMKEISHHRFDRLVTDVEMPQGGGEAVAGFAKATGMKRECIIAMSGNKKARAEWARVLLEKPFGHEDLLKAVEEEV